MPVYDQLIGLFTSLLGPLLNVGSSVSSVIKLGLGII